VLAPVFVDGVVGGRFVDYRRVGSVDVNPLGDRAVEALQDVLALWV